MASIKHATQASGTNNPDKQVSVNAWNESHVLTGSANQILGFDANGNATELDPSTFSTTNALTHVSDRSALSNIEATIGDTRFLVEPGREGLWTFDDTNLSAEVTADAAQGVYVAPATDTTGASGAWVRQFDGPVRARWFGWDEANAAAANDAAIAAMWTALTALKFNEVSTFAGLWDVDLGPGGYAIASAIEPPFACHVFGRGKGHGSADQPGGATRLIASGTTALKASAIGTIFSNMGVEGDFSGAEDAEYHGLDASATFVAENVNIRNFRGNGFNIVADSTTGANATGWRIAGCNAANCRDGIYTEGNNAGAGTCLGNNFFHSNRRANYNITDSVGSTVYFGASNGMAASTSYNDGTTIAASWGSYSGNRYGVIAGQEAGASTNPPSGTTADNTWWYYISSGAADTTLGCPAWVSGMSWRAGGCVLDLSLTSRNEYCMYAENNGPKSQIVQRSKVSGGFLALWCYQNPAANKGTAIISGTDDGAVNTTTCFQATSGSVTSSIGSTRGNTSNVAFKAVHSTYSTTGQNWLFTNGGNYALVRGTSTADGNAVILVTTNSTSQQFNTGANVADAVYIKLLAVGSSVANARFVTNGSAAPSTGAHGRGEICFNLTPSASGAGSNAGWISTAAGSPGTWKQFGGTAATSSATYAAPSGGTTVDTEGRASLAQLAADLADMRAKLQAAGQMA